MGGKCPHRRVNKRRYSHRAFRLAKFLVKDILFIVFSYFLLVFLNLTANYQTFCVFCFFNCVFSRDDAVYDELKKPDDEKTPLPLDEDLPGMGQYYCLHCE
ncbi:hypothetical protein HanHA300_Chr16g0627001 [Helianthus annuus]|nr:hypothetical protein HanHA300_Chr16g0627001 [Helianthus annuus]